MMAGIGTTTTGHGACRATWSLTGPSRSPRNPSVPRAPTTRNRASAAVVSNCRTGFPATSRAVTGTDRLLLLYSSESQWATGWGMVLGSGRSCPSWKTPS
jgi:hypothetical protein